MAYLPGPEPGPPFDDEIAGGPGRVRAWVTCEPAGRFTAGVAGVWLAGVAAHVAGLQAGTGATLTFIVAAVAALASVWAGARKVKPWESAPVVIGPAAAVAMTVAAGVWVTAAGYWGVNAPPGWWLTLALAAAAAGFWFGWLRSHGAVVAVYNRRDKAETWEQRKAFWGDLCRRVEDLAGCDLLDHVPTRLGEQVLLDTRGTGKLATQIRTRAVAERVGELWQPAIPRGRIDCWVDSMHGRIWIAIRSKDPWQLPVIHPALDPASIAAAYLAGKPSAVRPLVVGLDPETGEPFGLGGNGGSIPAGIPVWVPDQGGQVILVVATKGGGKTVALNALTERLTACEDMRVLQVNLTKPAEMRAWAPACPGNALGRRELGRARAILTWVEHYIDDYGETTEDAIAVPSAVQPGLAVIIDEVADVADDPVCKKSMIRIARTCRSAGVTLIIAGQRATAKWLGGADLRAMIDLVFAGRFARRDELDKAVGASLDLPDLGSYGTGAAGVFMLVDLTSGDYGRGRTLKLKEPSDCRRIARTRTHLAGWTPPGMAEDQAWLWEVIQGEADVPDNAYLGPAPAGADDEPARTRNEPERSASEPRDPGLLPVRAVNPAGAGGTLGGPLWDVPEIPAPALARLMILLGEPGGTSAGDAGQVIGKHRDTARKYLTAICAAGHARWEGEGRNRRYFAAERPALTRAPADGQGDDENDDDNRGDLT